MFYLVRKSWVGGQFLDHFSTARISRDCFKQLFNLTFKIVGSIIILFFLELLGNYTYSYLFHSTYWLTLIPSYLFFCFLACIFLGGTGTTSSITCNTMFLQLLCNKYQWPLTMADLESWGKYIRTLPQLVLQNVQAVEVEEASGVN